MLSLVIVGTEFKEITALLRQYEIPASMRIIILVRKNDMTFPINRLRNIAINLVKTTHFLVFDMDMFPSRTGFVCSDD